MKIKLKLFIKSDNVTIENMDHLVIFFILLNLSQHQLYSLAVETHIELLEAFISTQLITQGSSTYRDLNILYGALY